MTHDIAQYGLHALTFGVIVAVINLLANVVRHDERIKALEKSVDKLETPSGQE